ncbi:hypothetical protein [Intrasporangium flavum]|uniref:hypothetical protein n=1 Tax=Intrasporangium flavum TaxID=1428657 RepID=UPI00096FCD8E|nr:hypothetical protein [Intrasporangium flavum]
MTDLDHRRLGVDLYNATWDLLERTDRAPEDDDEMLARAHASMYHWLRFEGVRPENVGRGHWLVSRVHAVLGQADAAAYHASRYVTIARGGAGEGWDLAAALEASARAAAVGGDFDAAERYEAEARDVLASLTDPEDREVVEADLGTLPRRA